MAIAFRKANYARSVSNGGNAMKELRFYLSKAREINRRFRGKHIGIIGDRVVSSGKSPIEVWQRAKKAHPRSNPVLAYVRKDDALVLVLG